MSLRLKIAIGTSVLFHLGVLTCLYQLSHWRFQNIVHLGPGGGVVWLNLRPGGLGSGGAGGVGAPEQGGVQDLGREASRVPGASDQKTKGPALLSNAKSKSSVARPLTPALSPEGRGGSPELASKGAWQGPGVGDSEGGMTGPGQGEGEGLGGGQGQGVGPGSGPGGTGPLGTGGEGIGGEGSRILGQIRGKILRAKRYPREARQEGIEGACGIVFQITPDGKVASVKLAESSGHSILDQEALATVYRAAPFPYYAAPIQFKLRFSLKDR